MTDLLNLADTGKRRPYLRTVNGVGCRLAGSINDTRNDRLFCKVHWFTFLFVPLIPLGIYVCDRQESSYPSYLIYGRIPFSDFVGYFGKRSRWLLLSTAFETGAAIAIFVLVIGLAVVLKSALHEMMR